MKKHNVYSGPSLYPFEVLENISKGIIQFRNKKLSVLEISHRSTVFLELLDELLVLTRSLLNVPNDYSVLFLQGGGRLHLAQLPMNFLSPQGKAYFLDTGYWSQKAYEYANHYGPCEIVNNTTDSLNINIHELKTLKGNYLQYCANNTIAGTQFNELIQSSIPIVVDMSSEIFSREIDYSKVDVLLACAQKNFGPAGLSLLVIKDEFLATANDNIPAVFNYKNLASKNSNYSTPPVLQLAASLEMLRWIHEQGGVKVLGNLAKQRAQLLYDAIDNSRLVSNQVKEPYRSKMNIVFDAKNNEIEKSLITQFEKNNILGIKGHVSRGGFRVGNYVAQQKETIDLIAELIS